jgi:hypothetical protein
MGGPHEGFLFLKAAVCPRGPGAGVLPEGGDASLRSVADRYAVNYAYYDIVSGRGIIPEQDDWIYKARNNEVLFMCPKAWATACGTFRK